MRHHFLYALFGLLTLAAAVPAAEPAAVQPKLEALGTPVKCGDLPVFGYTRSASGAEQAWVLVRLPERRGILGVDVKTGKTTWVDLWKYGSHLMLGRVADNRVFVLVGPKKGLLLEWDPAAGRLSEHPLPVAAQYFMQVGGDVTPDGKVAVGTYPEVQIGWYDLKTGKTGGSKRLSSDPRQKYILYLVADKDSNLYCSVGLHHPELWTYNITTGKSRQLLPESYLKTTAKSRLYAGKDGMVYASIKGKTFRCTPEELIPVDPGKLPEFINDGKKNFPIPMRGDLADGRRLVHFDSECRLVLKDVKSGRLEYVPTDFAPFSPLVYSICGGLNGRIWVGSFTPAALASFSAAEERPEFVQYGKQGSGGVQIYWAYELPDRVYLSSYVGASLDVLNKATGESRKVRRLDKEQQERIFMLVPGPDGKIYGPTMPIKGHLGGGILEFDPATEKHRFYRDVIARQSIRALCPTAEGMLFGVSDINGGTSAIPSERDARIFLWDPKKKQVVWEETPLLREKSYLGAYRLSGSRVWTLSMTSRNVVVVDTANAQVVKTIALPRISGVRPVGSAPEVLGDRAFVLCGDTLYGVDIDSGKVEPVLTSPVIGAKFAGSLHGTHAEYLAPDGTFYCGSQAGLYRARLK